MRERPRIDPPVLRDLVERHVPPAPPLGDRPPDLVGAVPARLARERRRDGIGHLAARLRPHRRSAARCDPSASGSTSTWTTTASSAISRPCRIVHMFSVQPQPTTRSAPVISSAASGVAKPPETSRAQGLPVNRPFATADVASSAPLRSASRSSASRQPGPRAPRPATNTGRSAARERGGEPLQVRVRPPAPPAGRPATAPARPAPVSSVCTSSGRLSSTARRSPTAVATAAAACSTASSADVTRIGIAPTAAASAGWSTWKLERGPGRLGRDDHQRRAALRGLGDAGHRVGQPAPLVHAHAPPHRRSSARRRRPSWPRRTRAGRPRTGPPPRSSRW